jgi:anti-anti-sigma factor
VIHFEIENRFEEVAEVIERFENIAAEQGVKLSTRRSVKLALDEVLNNIISYAYQDDGRHLIEIDLELSADELLVRICDDGVAFNPLERAAPDVELAIEDRQPGGLGILLVDRLMDRFWYERKDERNVTAFASLEPKDQGLDQAPPTKGIPVQITTVEKDGVTVVAFVGNLDTNTSPQAQQKLDGLVADGSSRILVDFGSLDYLSSAGLRILLATAKKLRQAGGGLRFCGLNETVAEVFQISGFDRIFEIYGTEAEAMEDF